MSTDLVYVALFRVWPPYSGASSVSWGCAAHSSGRRVLLQLGGEAGRTFAEGVEVVTLPGGTTRWEKLLSFPRIRRHLVNEIRERSPLTVVVEGASWAVYCWLLIRYLRRLDPAPRIVYHAHNVEYLLRKPKSGPVVRRLTRWAEGRSLHLVDEAFAVSEREASQFEELYGVRPGLWPNGVDTSRYAGSDAEAGERPDLASSAGGFLVLFLGSYAYRPNAEAIDFLVERVFPRLLREVPGARLAVLGGEIPYSREWLLAPGEVPAADLTAWVRAAAVGTAPVFSGAGTRVKILEYMAAGLPVVATSKGAEGLDVRPGEDFLLAEDEADFVEALTRVARDPALAGSLGARGRGAVRTHYDWAAILSALGLRTDPAS